MNLLFKTNNKIFEYLKTEFSSEDMEFKDFSFDENIENTNIFYFNDPLLDLESSPSTDLDNLIIYSKNNNSTLFYIDTISDIGLTEATMLDESHPHKPIYELGEEREKLYKKFYEANISKIIIRIPDILGNGCNYYFNEFFSGKSNFLKWSGLTHINHEFIFINDLSKILLQISTNKKEGEYNIAGSKYSIEQIAATINELYNIQVKIDHLSPTLLLFKSYFDKLSKKIYEQVYLYKKPVFLNGQKFINDYGQTNSTDLTSSIKIIMEDIPDNPR